MTTLANKGIERFGVKSSGELANIVRWPSTFACQASGLSRNSSTDLRESLAAWGSTQACANNNDDDGADADYLSRQRKSVQFLISSLQKNSRYSGGNELLLLRRTLPCVI